MAQIIDGKYLDGKYLDGKYLDGKYLDGKYLDGKALKDLLNRLFPGSPCQVSVWIATSALFTS
jgi:hypothetical protein